ncbi:MAG: hypothetical protein ACXVA2_09625 [Mucilaginibacter sp.]
MKKILVILFALVFIVNLAHAQKDWVTYKIDNIVSVKFPGEPKESAKGSFTFTANDNTEYGISIEDFVAQLGIDSTRLAEDKNTPEFLSFMKEKIGSRLHDATIEDFEVDTWKGFTSYTNVVTGISKRVKMYIFMVLIGNKMYSLVAIIPDGVNTKVRDDFFSSLILNN